MIVGHSLLQPSKHLGRPTRASVGRARESMPRTRNRKVVLKGIVHRLYAFSALPTNAMQPAAGALSRVQDGRRIQRSVLGDGRTARGDRGGVRPVASAAGPEMTFILNLFHALDCAVAAVQAVAGRRRAEGVHGLDQGATDRHSASAPPPVRSRCGLHPHLRNQRGPNAMRPLSDARIAGRTRRRGKRLQANRRQPIQKGGMRLIESGHQLPARHKALLRKHGLARLPRMEDLSRRSRITKENGIRPRPHHGLP